jgi:hypothetical protein
MWGVVEGEPIIIQMASDILLRKQPAYRTVAPVKYPIQGANQFCMSV